MSAGAPDPVEGAPACVVCGAALSGQPRQIAGRPYCAPHYATARGGSRGLWPSEIALLAAQALLFLVMQVAGRSLPADLDRGWLTLLGLVLAVLPAVIWLAIFRRFDRLEPEPLRYLAGTLVLAALLAGAVGQPVLRQAFGLNRWQPSDFLWGAGVTILSEGVMLALVVYLAVRFTVFLAPEFDERADGIMYGVAAGLGAGILTNIHYVLDNGGVRLDVGAGRMIVVSLVAGSVGGLVGYGLGQEKFERLPAWYMPAIVLVAAVLEGFFSWLVAWLTTQSLDYTPWVGMAAAALFAVLVSGLLWVLTRRAVRETVALGAAAQGA